MLNKSVLKAALRNITTKSEAKLLLKNQKREAKLNPQSQESHLKPVLSLPRVFTTLRVMTMMNG